jgi:hypothetical protein
VLILNSLKLRGRPLRLARHWRYGFIREQR